jgi:NTP pyrophosphatase (non-canonical NTP hydrolase)
MDMKALQARLREFAAARDWQPFHSPKNLAMALMVEAAELLELFQWLTTEQSNTLTRDDADKERVGDEMADVLLYLLQLADRTGVDVEDAVERKLRKNAEKYPAKLPEKPAPGPKRHLLIDWENVQPRGDELRALAPEGTDVWLFHGPRQHVDASSHRLAYGASKVTLVPRPDVTKKNALDFQLSYYIGYISARQPQGQFVVVSNDSGYDPMLEHARGLGFDAKRCEFRRLLPAPKLTPSPALSPALPARNALPAAQTQLAQPALKLPEAKEGMAAPRAAAGIAASPRKASRPTPTPSKAPTPTPTPGKAPAREIAPPLNAKATRQEVQRIAQSLRVTPPLQRPANKTALLALIQVHLGEVGMASPRVAHALSQLQAQRHVVVKATSVRYPSDPVSVNTPTAPVLTKKPAKSAKKAAVPATAINFRAAAKPTAARIAQAVLVSLTKMPANKPSRRSGLLKFIETHASKASDPKSMAQQVCALLEAEKGVVVSENGEQVSYPRLQSKKTSVP